MERERAERDDPEEPAEALKSYQTILDQEARQARMELQRHAHGLVGSGLLAGFGIGISLFSVAVVSSLGQELPELWLRVLQANALTIGFIAVIMGRTDLFTEYTTLAILPILQRRCSVAELGRLWGLVLAANLVGAACFAALTAKLGPELGVIEVAALDRLAVELTSHAGSTILLSGFLAGWMMGLLSWLVTAGRDSVSQILFIWLITFSIGFGGLHHSISGSAEVLASLFAGGVSTLADYGRFVLWTTLGNAVGGILFAVLISFSQVVRRSNEADRRS